MNQRAEQIKKVIRDINSLEKEVAKVDSSCEYEHEDEDYSDLRINAFVSVYKELKESKTYLYYELFSKCGYESYEPFDKIANFPWLLDDYWFNGLNYSHLIRINRTKQKPYGKNYDSSDIISNNSGVYSVLTCLAVLNTYDHYPYSPYSDLNYLGILTSGYSDEDFIRRSVVQTIRYIIEHFPKLLHVNNSCSFYSPHDTKRLGVKWISISEYLCYKYPELMPDILECEYGIDKNYVFDQSSDFLFSRLLIVDNVIDVGFNYERYDIFKNGIVSYLLSIDSRIINKEENVYSEEGEKVGTTTPLFEAFKARDIQLFNKLLELGADINQDIYVSSENKKKSVLDHIYSFFDLIGSNFKNNPFSNKPHKSISTKFKEAIENHLARLDKERLSECIKLDSKKRTNHKSKAL